MSATGAGVWLRRLPPKATLLVGLWVVLVVSLAIGAPRFLSLFTLTTVLQFATLLALVSLGQALVVLCGGAGIDLSVGGAVSLSAVLALALVEAGLPWPLVPVACTGIGLALGLFNGLLVTRLALMPLIVTLATLYVYSGAALALTGGASRSGVPSWLTSWGRGEVAGVPLPFLTIALPAFALAALVLGRTAWGRWVYASGHDERSSRLVGVPVERLRLVAYGVSGSLAGLAGFVSIAWLGSARPNIGQNLELESLTAVMLGGVAIFGGTGGVGGVIAAVLLLVTLKTGLQFVNVSAVWQLGAVGALLIVVLLMDRVGAGCRSR